jgi:hypothetical protein
VRGSIAHIFTPPRDCQLLSSFTPITTLQNTAILPQYNITSAKISTPQYSITSTIQYYFEK